MGLTLHHVDVLVLTPSEPLETIAVKHVRNLPWPIRFLLRSVGAMRRGGANLASYLLFEHGYCNELIELGYHDTLQRREEVAAFVAGGLSLGARPYARTVRMMGMPPADEASPAGKTPPDGATATPPARRLSPRARDHDALDRQRRVRPREQRRVLLVLRHRGEHVAHRARRAGHRPPAVIGFVVETGCHYFAPLSYPSPVTAALRVGHVGRSSVRYEIALFAPGAETAAAQGHFVHVYVDRSARRPVAALPAALRRALEPLRTAPSKENP